MSTAFEPVAVGHHRETYFALLDAVNPLGLAYLHIAEGPDAELTPLLRQRRTGTVILNPFTPGAYTGPEALKLVESGVADLVSYAALFLANPNLPERLAAGGPFIALQQGLRGRSRRRHRLPNPAIQR
jgi:N-ethylmaleimide reductase